MKIAFVADTHFGYPRFEEDASAQGRAAIMDAAAKADVLLLGGDIFDTRVPKLETLAEVAGVLADAGRILSEKAGGRINAKKLVLGIHGTHERRGKGMLNPIQMMGKLGLMEDVHNSTSMLEMGGEKVAVSGMGGVPDDLVSDALKRLECKPVDGACNIFMFHQTMKEFVPQSPGLASIEELPEGYRWILCGHIHKRSEFAGGRLLIPGSTVITQLRDEEAGGKGYYLIDTKEGKAEWVPIPCRQMEVVNVELSGQKPSEARRMVADALATLAARKWAQKPIVKVKITGKLAHGAGELDIAGLEREELELFFDNSVDGAGIGQEFEMLRNKRMGKATPAEIGRARLAENAAKAGISPKRADELFAQFSE